jgi:hypothetical protein
LSLEIDGRKGKSMWKDVGIKKEDEERRRERGV